jgi:NRAMP (natural resistance-associated macrophage protein)-like metal ion transporter
MYRPKKILRLVLLKILFLFSIIGPGLITANIDNDAGGIATYSLAGAKTGLRLIWILFPITISLIIVQEMSARMGVVTKKGLADLIREKFGLKVIFYTFLFLILADFGNTTAEFAGIAASCEIFGVSKYISVPICAVFIWFLIVKGNYKIVERVFIFGCLIYLSYIVSGVVIAPPWAEVLHSIFVPKVQSIKAEDFPLIVGLIGTTITPWMQFYLQSAIVEKGIKIENLVYSKFDVIIGCLFMFVVSLFIVICCAATIYQSGIQITNAKDAALALAPLVGNHASTLFAIGLFNASIFSAALLPLATSYYVCEGLGFESGVSKTFKEAPHFFIIFTILIVFGAIFTLIPNINLFNILIWSQIINGILIPIILIFILKLCNDPEIMGPYTNSPAYNFIVKVIIVLIILANFLMIFFELK